MSLYSREIHNRIPVSRGKTCPAKKKEVLLPLPSSLETINPILGSILQILLTDGVTVVVTIVTSVLWLCVDNNDVK